VADARAARLCGDGAGRRHPNGAAARGALLPRLSKSGEYAALFVAVLGTTISPYLFFWQASEEAEEVGTEPGRKPLKRAPAQAKSALRRIRIDTYLGMAISNAVGIFIVVSTAATLHAHGVTNIQTSAQAAEALRPIAGPLAFAAFALGIVGTGLLAVPVLAGSAAYALGETFGWRVGLDRKLGRAPGFYAAIAAATLIGALINLTGLDPIKALFWSAVINGLVAAPVMAMTMLLAGRRDTMGRFTLPWPLALVGWGATAIMAAAGVAMFATMGH